MESRQPRTLKDPTALVDRHRRLDEPHVAPLNNLVRIIRQRLGPTAIVPYFDPADGGVEARILWLLEAPGPKATTERGGSGLISCDNNDGAAENTWRTRTEAGVSRVEVVHWNVIPYYLGTDTKIRAWRSGDVADAGPMLAELVALLPQLRSVILGGKAAREGWGNHRPPSTQAREFPCPHPSVTNVNTRPDVWPLVVSAWRAAAEWAATPSQ
ncbi:MAG: uracil-DNA glycosylase [Actinobacteria bacterium]|nr:uracil-DNA glycosylase [Actinomycetota bacterium]